MNCIDRILALKEERHLTGKQIESGAGLAVSSISQWKRGKGKPGLDNIIKLSSFFHVSTDYLLGLSDLPEHCPDAQKEDLTEGDLTQEEIILLSIYRNASAEDRFRIIQLCMNVQNKN